MRPAHLHGLPRHDAGRPAGVVRRCCRFSARSSAIRPAAATLFGWDAEEAVEAAREQVAKLIGAHRRRSLFTSGATESNNLAIKGVLEFASRQGQPHRHRARPSTTPCSTPVARSSARARARVTVRPGRPPRMPRRSPTTCEAALTPQTVLISIMLANNEIGTIHPLAEIGRIAKRRGVLFHSDATQGVGKIPVDVDALGVDLLSLSGAQDLRAQGMRRALSCARSDPRVRLAPLIERRRSRARGCDRGRSTCRASSASAKRARSPPP